MVKISRIIIYTLMVIAGISCSKTDDPYEAYYNGDYVTAREKLTPLVEKDNLKAITYLAAIHQMDQEFNAAVELYTFAAKHGYAPAQYNLAILLHQGKGIEKSIIHAYGWFYLAAEQGHSKANDQLKNIVSALTPNKTMQAKTWVKLQLN